MKSFFKNENKERNKIKNECLHFYNKIHLMKNVVLYKNDIWLPQNNISLNKVNKNTCFDIMESNINNSNYIQHNIDFDKCDIPLLKTKKIILKLNTFQQQIIKKWIEAYRLMYNETLRYMKEEYKKTHNKMTLNWMKLRTHLKDKRDIIVSKSGNTKKNQIKVHDIDYAIKLVCQDYKSAITNMKVGNIKSYRIRYWMKNKENKILDLEKNNFESGSIRRSVLGEVKGYYNGKEFKFSTITKDSRLIYNKGQYLLYVTEDVKKENKQQKNEIISLDPGIRTFMTGITENKVVEIGKGIKHKLEKYLNKTEEIKKKDIPKKIKIKIERRNNKKINDIVEELHWKSINYLTSNYKRILIGNMSTKSIISNSNTSNLSSRIKIIAQRIKLYEYRKKLQYKCKIRGVEYKCVNESYTSKMCSMCGNIKEDLGCNKEYECKECGTRIGRDVNGSRNIYMNSIRQ